MKRLAPEGGACVDGPQSRAECGTVADATGGGSARSVSLRKSCICSLARSRFRSSAEEFHPLYQVSAITTYYSLSGLPKVRQIGDFRLPEGFGGGLWKHGCP